MSNDSTPVKVLKGLEKPPSITSECRPTVKSLSTVRKGKGGTGNAAVPRVTVHLPPSFLVHEASLEGAFERTMSRMKRQLESSLASRFSQSSKWISQVEGSPRHATYGVGMSPCPSFVGALLPPESTASTV
jgi:hypothetical protein